MRVGRTLAQEASCRPTQLAVRAYDTDRSKQFVIVFIVNPICDVHAGVKSFRILVCSLFIYNASKTYPMWSVGTFSGLQD